MKVLIIGGTGLISSAVAREATECGHDVTIVTRGTSARAPVDGAETIAVDVRESGALANALAGREFDVAADFITFTPEQAGATVDALQDRVGHFLMISSASVYRTDPMDIPIRESTPLGNVVWDYPLAKQAAEEVVLGAYQRRGFPATIVRPSHTYDATSIPTLGGWTDVVRMRERRQILVHGDGTNVRVLTHSSDFARGFVGLFGAPAAVGEAFHITSEELLTWNGIYDQLARAAGGVADKVHVASETLARLRPEWSGALLGDRSHSKIFDNTKIRSVVPGWRAEISFRDVAAAMIADADAHPERQVVDAELDAFIDETVRSYR